MSEQDDNAALTVLSKDDVFMDQISEYLQIKIENIPRMQVAIAETVLFLEAKVPEINRIIHDVWAPLTKTDKILAFIGLIYEYTRKQFLVLVENVSELSNVIALEYETPWYPLMVAYVLIAQLLTIADDARRYFPPEQYSFTTYFPHKNDATFTAISLPAVVNGGFCVSARPVQQYSVYLMYGAMYIIKANLRNIDLEDEDSRNQWKDYLKALIRRSFVIVAEPGTDEVHDLKEFREALADHKGLFRATNDLIRRHSSSLTCFLCLLYFFEDYPAMPQPEVPFDDEQNTNLIRIYKDICEQSRILISRTDERMHLAKMIHNHTILIGQRAVFVEDRTTQEPKPYSITSMTVMPQVQITNKKLVNTMAVMDVIDRIGLTIMDNIYFRIVTTSEQVMMNMLMLHGMEAIMDVLDERKYSFMYDFFVHEPFFFTHKNEMISRKYPIVFLIQDVFHVFASGCRYKCDNLTHAILIWARIFEREFKGIYNATNMMPVLKRLLVLDKSEQVDNGWINELIGI